MEAVSLKISALPESTLAIRLLAAGLANLCRLDFEEIEDLKLAVSEACFCVFNKNEALDLTFLLEPEKITVEVKASSPIRAPFPWTNGVMEKGFGFLLMRDLVDSFDFQSDDSGTKIHMTKGKKK